VISINVILAFIGFLVGAGIGMTVFALVMDGERGQIYRLFAVRHPWIRLVPILWIVACGVVVAIVTYRLAE
jgi:ABC-type antimicrobial peptide transport system permease subunit